MSNTRTAALHTTTTTNEKTNPYVHKKTISHGKRVNCKNAGG